MNEYTKSPKGSDKRNKIRRHTQQDIPSKDGKTIELNKHIHTISLKEAPAKKNRSSNLVP